MGAALCGGAGMYNLFDQNTHSLIRLHTARDSHGFKGPASDRWAPRAPGAPVRSLVRTDIFTLWPPRSRINEEQLIGIQLEEEGFLNVLRQGLQNVPC